MENDYSNETLYSQTELLQMINGLQNVYWSTPWWLRMFMRPWHNALNTLALQIAGDKIVDRLDTEQLLDDIENYLPDRDWETHSANH